MKKQAAEGFSRGAAVSAGLAGAGRRSVFSAVATSIALVLALASSCGGGGNGPDITPGGGADDGCDGTCAQQSLTAEDVQAVVAQAVAQAQSLGVVATIAVTDRVGNVLAVFAMDGAPATTTLTGAEPDRTICPVPPAPGTPLTGGLQCAAVPSTLAAISKAGTAAYLSTQGNAFTTRTASQIVQSHFNPGERGQPGGPLFGVQFSQLPCGDLVTRFPEGRMTGPNRLPLGLAGDPGAVPLYKPSDGPGKSGAVAVGGVGVESGPFYTIDLDVQDDDIDLEERIAVAGSRGFEAPKLRRADRITAGGRSFRFTDDDRVAEAAVSSFPDLPGALVKVPGFYGDPDPSVAPAVLAGQTLGQASSGILSTTFSGMPAEVLVDPDGNVRFPPTSARTPGGLTVTEVSSILANGLEVIARVRAQIRNPLGTPAQVTVSVVGVDGEVLGQVRSPDAPVFGIDVSLQKARAAAFFSSATAADQIRAAGTVTYPDTTTSTLASYVDASRTLFRRSDLFTGTIAFSNRAIGNLARPFFPDGIDGNQSGPLSKPAGQWSPFNTGIELDLVLNGILSVLGGGDPRACSLASPSPVPPYSIQIPQIANGVQIFPGSVPVYRGDRLVGGVGISGDGVDQDDLIALLALQRASEETGTINQAPKAIRSDTLSVEGSFLRYVNCPPQPFLDSDQQDACNGL